MEYETTQPYDHVVIRFTCGERAIRHITALNLAPPFVGTICFWTRKESLEAQSLPLRLIGRNRVATYVLIPQDCEYLQRPCCCLLRLGMQILANSASRAIEGVTGLQ